MRKNLSEFSVLLYSARWQIIQSHQLNQKLAVRPFDKEILEKCHIYLICRRPSVSYFLPAFKIDRGKISGTINYKLNGNTQFTPFEIPISGRYRDIALSDYPHREITYRDTADGEEYILPASNLSLLNLANDQTLRNLEVLYVGQAYGDGTTSAIDRLRNHSTLQRILAEASYNHPDDEIVICTFEYKDYKIITSIDGISPPPKIDMGNENKRFLSIYEHPLSEFQ